MWPVIVEIPLPGGGGLPIRSFGLMVVLGFLAASALMQRICAKEGTATREQLDKFFFYELIAVVLGARLMYVLTELPHFIEHPGQILRIDRGGMVMYGGLLGCVGVGIWFLRRAGLPVWRIADVGGMVGALGLGIGRIGCLLVGDDFGKPCGPDFPLGIMFPTDTRTGSLYGLEIAAGNGNLIERAFQGVWLHPAQIYMAVNGFLMFAVLWSLYRRKKFHGQIFLIFVMLKAATRSVIEVYRGDVDRGFVGSLSTSQFIAALTVVAAAAAWFALARRPELRVRSEGGAAA